MGLPGLECRLPLLVSGALDGRLTSLEQAVAVGCTNPARLYGLYPRKGTLQPGSDADVVLLDASAECTVSKAGLHDDLDYTPYEGIHLRGAIVRTLLRGLTVFRRGTADEGGGVSAPRGGGQFLACGRPDLLGWSGREIGREWPDAADLVQQRCVEILGPALDGVIAGEEEESESTSGASSSRKRGREAPAGDTS